MITDYTKFALSSLLHRKMRSWLTMLGIIIGISSVVALISLGQGMKEAIGSVFLNIGSDKLVVSAKSGMEFSGPPGSSAASNLTTHDLEIIKKVNGVEQVAARLIKPAKLEFNNEVKYYFAASMILLNVSGWFSAISANILRFKAIFLLVSAPINLL